MINCTFELNSKPLSNLILGGHKFPAYSGRKEHVNRRISACLKSFGPIPPGNIISLIVSKVVC